jgi:Ca-activated chloride channel family protein
MKTLYTYFGIALLVTFFFGLHLGYADGLIIIDPESQPHPVPRRLIPAPQPLSIKYHRVDISLDNHVAVTTVDQVFKNNYDLDLEGVYIFPLPEEAAISDFSMYMNGKRVRGEILDKEQARIIYEDIVRRMKDPGLLEYAGRNMFKARIYPVPRHGESRIQLTYSQALSYDSGVYTYVYPLNTERFSPQPLEEVTISARINTPQPLKSIYSPSHDVDIHLEEFQASVGFEGKNVKPEKDFVLYYTVSGEDVGLSQLFYRTRGEDGYFLMLLAPGMPEAGSYSKDIVFVLDTSGSMRGDKLLQAKEALNFCISNLADRDRFNVIGFATMPKFFDDALVEVSSDSVNEALVFVKRLQARGGTNINDTLLASLKMFDGSPNPCMIVFLTDGEPTVGETSIKGILKNLKDTNRKKVRFFSFGVGYEVNTHLLDNISIEHRGTSEYVTPVESIEKKVSSFFTKISEPVLSDISLDFDGIRVDDVYPATLPDIFKGSQLVLLGRYRGSGSSRVTLTGRVQDLNKRFIYEDQYPASSESYDFIPRLWAMRKIGFLLNEIRLNGEVMELIDEVVELSTEYGIITPYTSFLILEKDSDYEQWGISREMEPSVRAEGEEYSEGMRMSVGKKAVESSMDIADLKETLTSKGPITETVKHIGNKTFYLRNGRWVDGKFKEGMKVINIEYLSERYFDVIRRIPELGRYFSTAKTIMVVTDGICYSVTE